MKFSIQHQDSHSKARVGLITTSRGTIRTPVFMPVGSMGSVKSISQQVLHDQINTDIILSNTYHLYLRPGIDILDKAGGLHNFMGWYRPILTDSGGYQIYSLSNRREITEMGVIFRSYKDGSKHLLTPELVVDIQRKIGSDIMMVLDECTPYPCSYDYAKVSMKRTHNWLKRGIEYFDTTLNDHYSRQTIFPIVQGSVYKDLRVQSAEIIASADRSGNAIGGVCHPNGQLYDITELVCSILPSCKPRYLMGVGMPVDILECIALGVDMFDCVIPTRNGRNGILFTTKGIINIKNKKWSHDFNPIDDGLSGTVSNYYSKAYLRHLITCNELLGAQLASIHNLTFYLWLMSKAREKIQNNEFVTWKNYIIKTIMDKI